LVEYLPKDDRERAKHVGGSQHICIILCFVDRASLYNLVNKANLVHSFS